MRIAIVNDTRLAVEALRRAVTRHGHQVAWVALDGAAAVEHCASDTPDLLLMDLIMPVMGGVEATRRIMAGSPCAILVVTASVQEHSGSIFSALGLGALDAVATPTLGGDGGGGEALMRKIETIGKLLHYQKRTAAVVDAGPSEPAPGSNLGALVVIGASAGGPKALATVLGSLPPDLESGLAIVQHLDVDFAESLANWLSEQSRMPVKIAASGTVIRPGTAWLAGTAEHMILAPDGRLKYRAEPNSPYHPSVDVFFESVAQNWRGRVTGVVLTGMGRDGAAGLLKLRARGHHTIAQDQATSAVYGMPKAAFESGAAVEVLPIGDIARALQQRCKRG